MRTVEPATTGAPSATPCGRSVGSRWRQPPGRSPFASGSAQYSSRLRGRAVRAADEVQGAVRGEARGAAFGRQAGSRRPGMAHCETASRSRRSRRGSPRRCRRRRPPGAPLARRVGHGAAECCRAGRRRSGPCRRSRRRPRGTCPRTRCSPSATGCSSAGCSLNAPSLPLFASRVAFQTVAVGLPSAPQPPATTMPSVTATAAAPERGAGSVRSALRRPRPAPTSPSALVSGSSPSDQTVSVGLPSGPCAADEVGRAVQVRDRGVGARRGQRRALAPRPEVALVELRRRRSWRMAADAVGAADVQEVRAELRRGAARSAACGQRELGGRGLPRQHARRPGPGTACGRRSRAGRG